MIKTNKRSIKSKVIDRYYSQIKIKIKIIIIKTCFYILSVLKIYKIILNKFILKINLFYVSIFTISLTKYDFFFIREQ